MTAPALRVDSATGVEVALPIAGPGARAFAFSLDYLFSAALAVAWYGISAWVYNRITGAASGIRLPAEEVTLAWLLLVALPASTLFFLYHFVFELWTRGSTPGKRIAGVRVATLSGATPGPGALLVRNLFRVIDSLPLVYLVGLLSTLLTARAVRIGDLAAGTVLLYQPRHVLPAIAGAGPVAELATELAARWPHIDTRARVGLAQALLRRCGHAELAAHSDATRLRQAVERLAAGMDPPV
ncbi:MAG: RDD family protein [Steroidobacteraceae bacterium]|nr:RDD family protein [Steroidobacteraceae bacterium]MDW8259421.1 RDD family protein [Gammaproteobacteria bacterium]